MNLLVPAALAFSAIIPIILILYFMRPRRQERVVASTFLWRLALQDLQASRPWQRLRVTPLLILQLLAAAVIVLILTRPAIFTNSPVSGDTIIILQASASMQATDVAPNRFESAKNSIADFISSLGPDDRLSLITMARTPQALIANSQDKALLNAALQHAQVTNQDADLEQALELASSLAQGRSGVQILVIGDGHVTTPTNATLVVPFPVRYFRVGTDAPNAAITALSSRVVQNQLIAFAQVANFSHQSRSIPVKLYADSRLIGVKTVSLPPNSSSAVQWGPLASSTRYLHATLDTQDAMTVDHQAWAIVGGSLHARVLLVTKDNLFLQTALNLQSNIDLYETTPDKYATSTGFDLTIFDGYVPSVLPVDSVLFVNPPPGSYPFGSSGQLTKVTHLSTSTDPFGLLSGVDLGSIHVLRVSHLLHPALWAQTIITANETPLLLAGENNSHRIAVLGFDLHDSDLPLQPSFPIFIHNLTNWFLPLPVSGDAHVTAGSPISIQTWPGATHVTITDPTQRTTVVAPPFPVSPYTTTNTVGIYQVSQSVNGHTLTGAFTVNLFDPEQSSLAPASVLPILHSTSFANGGNSVPRQLREIWPWIAAFLLLVLCTEWWLFSRNYRQQPFPSQRQGSPSSRRLPASRSRSVARIPFVAALQRELQQQYSLARKKALKVTRRARTRFKRRTRKDLHLQGAQLRDTKGRR